jgi:hypothetical protein
MQNRRDEDRFYTAILMAFLVALVALGLLGVPALLVGAIGIGVAALAIALFHGRLETRHAPRPRGKRSRVPTRYVPSVLEGSSMRHRRLVHLRRHRSSIRPLRFR